MTKNSSTHQCVEKRPCLHVSTGKQAAATVTMIHEKPVELRINGHRLIRTQCMCHEVEEMAVGFMVCEGILQKRSELQQVHADLDAGIVDVIGKIPEERIAAAGAHTRLASGGSKTGVIDLMQEKVKNGFRIASKKTIDVEHVIGLGNEFNNYAGLYRDSRFVHSAALSDGKTILCHSEDVGRHNAVDKVLGHGFMKGLQFGDLVLLCSGRFSLEMVSKVACVSVPIYISPAAPSVESVELAECIGMALCGRVKRDSANIYASSWRITGTQQEHR
jgi:FdhD protein